MVRRFPFLSPDAPEVGEAEALVHQVRVLPLERSNTITYRPHGADLIAVGKKVVNPRVQMFQVLEGSRVSHEFIQPNRRQNRDDLDAYCYGPHTCEALALLQPRCFFHGREPRWDARVETTVLNRAADVLPMRRTIPLTDPRIMGDALNPTVFDEAEETEVVVDRERSVVLEWRALFDGKVYERHHFTEIHFDESMDETEFDPDTRVQP